MTSRVPGYEHFHQDGTATVTRRSGASGEIHTRTLPITIEQYMKWDRGAMIQDAFPNLLAEDREFLLTGITPLEWRAMFEKGDDIVALDLNDPGFMHNTLAKILGEDK